MSKYKLIIEYYLKGNNRTQIATLCDCSRTTVWSVLKRANKFFYYYLDGKYEELRAISNGDGTRGGLSLRLLAPYKNPVPPIEVQERIVKVLDNFDEICSNLKIGLPAEMEKRQQQYEYYREKLLTFDTMSATILRQTDRQTDRAD